MAITLPLPVRVAAGILGAGIDLLRALPDEVPAIPVTLVGNAMRLSMKVQQEIAALATRGDELLGGVIGAPQESPAWAKFDDDDDEPVAPVTAIKPPGRTNQSPGTAAGKAPERRPVTVQPQPDPKPEPRPNVVPSTGLHLGNEPRATADTATDTADASPALTTPEATSLPPTTTIAMEAAIEVPLAVVESATGAADDAAPELTELRIVAEADEPADEPVVAADPRIEELSLEELSIELDGMADLPDDAVEPVLLGETEELTAAIPIPEELIEQVEAAAEGPAALPDYDRMTLAQVRGHLRELSADDVAGLLRYEQDGDNRAPFLTLLSNRLVTLDAQNS